MGVSVKRKIKLSVLIALKFIGFFHLAKYLTRKNLKILCYHGFSEEDQYLYDDFLFIKEETFERRMELLKKWKMNVATLDVAIEEFEAKKNKDNSLVITFDDGWKSTMKAIPILKRLGFPSTLYVASYYCNKEFPVFNVYVRFLSWRTKEIGNLKTMFENEFKFSLVNTDKDFLGIVNEIIQYGNQSDLETKRKIINFMTRISGEKLNEEMFKYINEEELNYIKNSGMSLELHTHRHQFHDNSAKIIEDLDKNKEFLKTHASVKGSHLCYPSGVYYQNQFETLKKAGIKSATTTNNKPNRHGDSLFELGRFLDRDSHHDIEFEASICGVFDLVK